MTIQRAAPGPQLSTGRLRVDAAKAIAKLREYQLANRTAWVLEAVRAAVAAGATAIELQGDANDVWLSWTGEPWPTEALPRLFDELVSPEPTHASQHLRLLAAAVNSALGVRPAYVDVYAIAGDRTASRVRYTPDVLDTPEGDETPLREVRVEAHAPPTGAPAPGMMVHLRRRAGLTTLGYLFAGEPPELALARAACTDITVPMRIAGIAHGRDLPGRDLIRLPLDQDLDGFVALVDPAATRPETLRAVLDIAERGVILTSYALPLAIEEPVAPVPLRLFVDAPRMPTNASRSEVRRQAHPIAAAEARARELVPALIARLIADLTANPDEPRLRAAALALLAGAAAGADWSWRLAELTGGLRQLAELPLLRDAVGERCSVLGPWRPLGVHVGAKPFDAVYAPWLGSILWVPPGDAAACLIAGASVNERAIRREARVARRQLRAQRRFEKHPPRQARLAEARPIVSVTLGAAATDSCVPQAWFDRLDGEVGIFTHDSGRGELTLLLAGRDIEVIGVPGPISFSAVVDSPRLAPADHYRGVIRDAELRHVEQAVAGAVIRAAEALARIRDGGDVPDGVQRDDAQGASPEREQALLRRAIEFAHERGLPVAAGASPLATSGCWITAVGDRVSLVTLREQQAIGFTAPGSGVLPPAGRVVIAAEPAERTLLAAMLAPIDVVDYDARSLPRSLDRALDLGRELARAHGVALVIREAGVAGAIAPDDQPRLMLGHAGVHVTSRACTATLASCTIAVDVDALVPDETWRNVRRDAGMSTRDFRPWELALVRAIAGAIAGQAAPELISSGSLRLDDARGGNALCSALVNHDDGAIDLLGEDLVARLCKQPIVNVLGALLPTSIEAVVAAFPGVPIPYVAPDAAQAGDDYRPLLASPLLAGAVGKLAGRLVEDGSAELTRRRNDAERAARRATHLAQPVRPLALPDDAGTSSVPLGGELGEGIVGVGRGTLELVLHVEGRPFQTVTRPVTLPLIAVIDVAALGVDPTYGAVLERVVDQLATEVEAASDALLARIATTTPTALTDDPRTLALLAAWLRRRGSDWPALQALRSAATFVTVQGGRAAIKDAKPRDRLGVAVWDGVWLAAAEGEPADPLDAPIVRVHGDAMTDPLHAVIADLEPHPLHDLTDAVRGLQAQRRMARGLLPVPAVPNANPVLRRMLSALGDEGRALGPGEIALSLDDHASVLLHAGGKLACSTNLDIHPPVQVAIEAPELVTEVQILGSLDEASRDALIKKVQPAATRLAREVARESPDELLSPTIRRHLRRAALTQWLSPEDVAGLALFETTAGSWLRWSALAEQLTMFPNLWYVDPASAQRPLDERRVAFRLVAVEAQAARILGFEMFDAITELALDAEAQRNQARPAVTSLELTWDDQTRVLATRPLTGDGLTSVRGLVAPLVPARAADRRARVHRALKPFDPVNDPCDWPTLSVVDDARLVPDRTWSVPVGDGIWTEAARQIREASEHALRGLVEPPVGALASRVIGPELYGGLSPYPVSPKLQIRGALWLAEATDRGVVHIDHVIGEFGLSAEGAPVRGRLLLHSTERDPGNDALRKLIEAVYAVLLKDAIGRLADHPAQVTAHLARGLVLGRIAPADVGPVRFDCFRPAPLDAEQLIALLGRTDRIALLEPHDLDTGEAVIADGSTLSFVIQAALGGRAVRPRPRPRRPTMPGFAAPPPPSPVFEPLPVPAAPAPQHQLQGLGDLVGRMLAELGLPSRIAIASGRKEPIARHEEGRIELAGDAPRLWTIDARRVAGGPDGVAAVEALLAHVVNVLNQELAEVTDVSEGHALARLLG